jgi:hypothetical protein
VVVGAGLVARLGIEVHRLLFVPAGPIDLLIYRKLIRDWFADVPVYEGFRGAIHPPGVFLLLWPIYGWAPTDLARWIYALTTGLAVAAFAGILLREARPVSRMDRALLAVLVVTCYPAAITIGNGQITFYVLFAALAGILLLLRKSPSPRRDAVLSALFLVALIKPNLTLPFFWVIAFSKGWFRPVMAALIAYLAATVVSIALHGTGLEAVRALLEAWYARGEGGFARSGYGNIHSWLGELGLRSWIFPASGLVFALHGLWAWRHRGADLWTLIGVAAIVARLWAYHRVYDDLLLIFPVVALYRLARRDDAGRGARRLFALGCVALATPVTLLVEHASWVLVAVWILQLAFLMRRARPSPGRATVSAA